MTCYCYLKTENTLTVTDVSFPSIGGAERPLVPPSGQTGNHQRETRVSPASLFRKHDQKARIQIFPLYQIWSPPLFAHARAHLWMDFHLQHSADCLIQSNLRRGVSPLNTHFFAGMNRSGSKNMIMLKPCSRGTRKRTIQGFLVLLLVLMNAFFSIPKALYECTAGCGHHIIPL